MGEDIYSVYSQYMALDSFHAQIQISDSKCDMGQFPIFNKRWLSWTGDADICSYNSFPNSVPGWLVTSFNRAKCWETSLPFFHLIYNKNLLVHCFICVWMRFDSQSFFFLSHASKQPRGMFFTAWELFTSWTPGQKECVMLVFQYSSHLEAEAFFFNLC